MAWFNVDRRHDPSARERIVVSAARLFAERSYAATTIDDVGQSVGVSGPAIYWHFRSKEHLLSTILIDVSTRLRDGARTHIADAVDTSAALATLIAFQVDFALDNQDLIVIHARELVHLPDAEQRLVRRAQREYMEEWVGLLGASHADASADTLHQAVQAAIGLINTTPYLRTANRQTTAAMLRAMAAAALGSIGG